MNLKNEVKWLWILLIDVWTGEKYFNEQDYEKFDEREFNSSDESEICEFPSYYFSSDVISKWSKNAARMKCKYSHTEYFYKHA